MLETLSLFSQPEIPEKVGGSPKLDWSQGVTGRVYTKRYSVSFPENSGRKNQLWVSFY